MGASIRSEPFRRPDGNSLEFGKGQVKISSRTTKKKVRRPPPTPNSTQKSHAYSATVSRAVNPLNSKGPSGVELNPDFWWGGLILRRRSIP
ncbi:hypothetical protein CDAR_605351 [Caerostris darwini]|uniref:Uncharacterized protein n=1 Tax=Caerostris darwini TaxID=1538125 RepID=A0AAV4PB11_9ARAC|nr:hypothetical protein CDAR_605351 [Caerostris darwini]